MIYAINYNDNELSGRVTLKGKRSRVLNEYRLITRAMCDRFGADDVLKWTAGLARDDIKSVNFQIEVEPDQGGEYMPEEVKSIE